MEYVDILSQNIPENFDSPSSQSSDTIIVRDTMNIVIQNYYWFSQDNNELILTYSETSKSIGNIGELFQDIKLIGKEATAFDYEEYKELINLQCSPNPGSHNTTISYELPESSSVKLFFSNTVGTVNFILVNNIENEGTHSVTHNVSNLIGGSYQVKLIVNGIAIEQIFIKN